MHHDKLYAIIIMAILLSPLATAGTVKIYPTDDAYITDGNQAGTNMNNNNLRVGYDLNQGKHRSYLKFDLSSLRNKNVQSAKLVIDPVAHVGNINVQVRYVSSDSWNENTITWNNAPTYNSEIVDVKTINSNDNVQFSITSLTGEQDKIISIALTSAQESNPNNYVQFFSKDMEEQFYDPYIEIVYEGETQCNTPADANCDGIVSLTEYNDFKYGYKNGLVVGVSLTQYNDIKHKFKNGLL